MDADFVSTEPLCNILRNSGPYDALLESLGLSNF